MIISTAAAALHRKGEAAGASSSEAGGYNSVDGRAPRSSDRRSTQRPRVYGKFLFRGQEKLYVRGVTYGTFRPDADGVPFPDRMTVETDFWHMAQAGVNAVRTYTVPPRWLLDAAARHGLCVLVGLPWEQHIAFLDDPRRARHIEQGVADAVRSCAGHPAILAYAIGNEIPATIVRWHGARNVERFLQRLYRAAKQADPEGLVTYVNYPSTEYLHLPFLDFGCFNVYLESREALSSYLAHLQVQVGDRPLLIGELGLDSRRNGEQAQARTLEWQVRCAFEAGCAGAFVFAWTDEWHRGGDDVLDWDFGLTDRARQPKPALASVQRAFDSPLPSNHRPSISVVVCSFNGGRTLRDCLDGLRCLRYPDYEVIVVDDGSTDDTAAIARACGVRVISTPNQGLSAARNVGLHVATGQIVAYIDDDAYPDPDWLSYLAHTFATTTYVGVGGPNIPPPEDGPIAHCVANAPGGPIHVLLSDREAEHIPGCNMAFQRQHLLAIGGFDPRFRAAGDDVDVCWRLQARGWALGFSPAAVVWHHRRNSVRAFWKQQVGYGKAEALLERKWPEKYNPAGHVTWHGRLYGRSQPALVGWHRSRVYHGTWGTALFQRLYHPSPDLYASLLLMPEWYLLIPALAGLSALGSVWHPLLLALPVLLLTLAAALAQAGLGAARARFAPAPRTRGRWRLRGLTFALHLLQPLARLHGRLLYGLTPWRQRRGPRALLPTQHSYAIWSESGAPPHVRLERLERALRAGGAYVLRGGAFDRWDLEVGVGMLGRARVRMVAEEHGAGRQLIRFQLSPHLATRPAALSVALAVLAVGAGCNGAWPASLLLALPGAVILLRALGEAASAAASARQVLAQVDTPVASDPRRAA